MSKQFLGLFKPANSVYERAQRSIELLLATTGKQTSREEIIEFARKRGTEFSEAEIQQLLDIQQVKHD